MGFLSGVDYNAQDAVESDVLGGGFKPFTSDVYDFEIKLAYYTKAQSGAVALNLELVTPDGRRLRDQNYITNKEGGNKFKDKQTGEMKYLPGFLTADSLCLLAAGIPLVKVDEQVETKTINLYSYEQKREVPTDVPMLMPLIGKRIKAGVLERIENKSKKNQSTGVYEPINEKRTVNVISKFFRQRDDLTVAEIKARLTDPKFIKDWIAQWQGKPDDRYKEVTGQGSAGMPGGSFAGAGSNTAPDGTTGDQDNLFM